MSDIDISRSHSLGLEKGRSAVEKVAEQLEDRLGVDSHWENNTLQFNGGGADGHIKVESDTVHVQIKLGMLLRSMKGMVKKQAEGYLDQHFG